MFIWESSQWLWKNFVWSSGKKGTRKSMDRCTGRSGITEIILKHFWTPYSLYQMTKTLDLFKLKAFCRWQNKFVKRMKFDWGRKENIVGKGENAGYQHFLLFPQCFLYALFSAPLAEGQRAIVMAWWHRASVRPCVRASVNFFFKKTSPQKLLTGF